MATLAGKTSDVSEEVGLAEKKLLNVITSMSAIFELTDYIGERNFKVAELSLSRFDLTKADDICDLYSLMTKLQVSVDEVYFR